MLQKPPHIQSNWDNWNCAPYHFAIKISVWLHCRDCKQQNKAFILHCNFWFVSIKLNPVFLAKKQPHFSGNDSFLFQAKCQFLLGKIKLHSTWQFDVSFLYNHFCIDSQFIGSLEQKWLDAKSWSHTLMKVNVKIWGQTGNLGRKSHENQTLLLVLTLNRWMLPFFKNLPSHRVKQAL